MRTSDEVIFMPMNCANKCTVKSYYKSVVIYLYFSNPKPSLFIPFLFLFNLLSCFYLSQQSGLLNYCWWPSITTPSPQPPCPPFSTPKSPSRNPNSNPSPNNFLWFLQCPWACGARYFWVIEGVQGGGTEDNMMTLEEFLAKARAGPLEEEVDFLQRACLEEYKPWIPSCHQTPLKVPLWSL